MTYDERDRVCEVDLKQVYEKMAGLEHKWYALADQYILVDQLHKILDIQEMLQKIEEMNHAIVLTNIVPMGQPMA